MIRELIEKTRSYRRFDATREIDRSELLHMVEAARLSGSAANRQRIRFALVNSKEECDGIFSNVAFAGYLKEWSGPSKTERPTAYVALMCAESSIDTSLAIDIGIAAQSILLTATEMGLGGCMIRSFEKSSVEAVLGKTGYNAVLLIALGAPTEKVYITDAVNGDVKYYRDENDAHAVPKRPLDELVI